MIVNFFRNRLYYFPILTACWFTLTYLLTYCISVLKGHVNPFLPYISFAGSTSPESCIFGFMLTLGVPLMFICIYVRYRQFDLMEIKDKPMFNNISYYIGIFCNLGIIIMANFQESNLVLTHHLGVLLTFSSAITYCSFQAWITWKSASSRFIKLLRIILCAIMVPLFFANFLFGNLSMRLFRGYDMKKWREYDGGYDFHLTSAISEWIMAIVINIFIFTFYVEFKKIKYDKTVFTNSEIYDFYY